MTVDDSKVNNHIIDVECFKGEILVITEDKNNFKKSIKEYLKQKVDYKDLIRRWKML